MLGTWTPESPASRWMGWWGYAKRKEFDFSIFFGGPENATSCYSPNYCHGVPDGRPNRRQHTLAEVGKNERERGNKTDSRLACEYDSTGIPSEFLPNRIPSDLRGSTKNSSGPTRNPPGPPAPPPRPKWCPWAPHAAWGPRGPGGPPGPYGGPGAPLGGQGPLGILVDPTREE